MKDLFLRVAGCEFIQLNRRSASFECWVYHFELDNPLNASIMYSNESMKREIWKVNLKTCKKNLWKKWPNMANFTTEKVSVLSGVRLYLHSRTNTSQFSKKGFALNLILEAMDLGLGNGLFCEADSFKRILRDSVKPPKMTKWREFMFLCLHSTRSTS